MNKLIDDPRTMRMKRGETQTEFWSRLGVSQSAGSRFETFRTLPHWLRIMIVIAYGTQKQSAKLVAALRGK